MAKQHRYYETTLTDHQQIMCRIDDLESSIKRPLNAMWMLLMVLFIMLTGLYSILIYEEYKPLPNKPQINRSLVVPPVEPTK